MHKKIQFLYMNLNCFIFFFNLTELINESVKLKALYIHRPIREYKIKGTVACLPVLFLT